MGEIGLLLIIVAYFFPVMVAAIRSHNITGVAIVNVVLGWTGIGWIAALIMACGSKPQPVIVQQYGVPPVDVPARFDTVTGKQLSP